MWFPHALAFCNRAYPVPPHLNNMGPDPQLQMRFFSLCQSRRAFLSLYQSRRAFCNVHYSTSLASRLCV